MKDRRKTLYCGPSHRITPTLGVLANCLLSIENIAKELYSMNYASSALNIQKFARTAQAEVDKLIMLENREVDNAERNKDGA